MGDDMNAFSQLMAEKRQRRTEFIVQRDDEARILTVQGIRYAYDLFNVLAFGKSGERFEIGKRDRDGTVTLIRIEPHDHAADRFPGEVGDCFEIVDKGNGVLGLARIERKTLPMRPVEET